MPPAFVLSQDQTLRLISSGCPKPSDPLACPILKASGEAFVQCEQLNRLTSGCDPKAAAHTSFSSRPQCQRATVNPSGPTNRHNHKTASDFFLPPHPAGPPFYQHPVQSVKLFFQRFTNFSPRLSPDTPAPKASQRSVPHCKRTCQPHPRQPRTYSGFSTP